MARNVTRLRGAVAPAAVWAVVKADGYGHGAVAVARTALAAGAQALCVALVDEGLALRAAGIGAPVLVLSEQPPTQVAPAVDAGLQADGVHGQRGAGGGLRRFISRSTPACIARLRPRRRDRARTGDRPPGGHVHAPGLRRRSLLTGHRAQLALFEDVLRGLAAAGVDPGVIHAANSAERSLTRLPGSTRCEWASPPTACVRDLASLLCRDLEPAMRLVARVSAVRRVAEGVAGHRYTTASATTRNGARLRRRCAAGARRRLPRARPATPGVVTMDHFVLDCGDDEVAVGDEVVLGRQGADEILGR